MADSAINSNIFGENFSSFVLELEQFKSLDKLAAPAREHLCSDKQVYTIIPQTINSETVFPVFTDAREIEPPLLQKKPLDFLKIIFSNPAIQTILINPSAEKTESEKISGKTIKLNRNKLSIMIGSLQSNIKKEDVGVFLKKIISEMNQGNFHNANYISSLAIAQGNAQQVAAVYPQILINLRLYQDAYDFVEIFPKNPLMLYYSAVIFRVTGNFKNTSEILNSIPEDIGMENKKNLQKAWIDMSLGNFNEAEEKFKSLLISPLEKNEAGIGLGMTLFKKGISQKDLQALNDSLSIFKESLDLPGGLNAQAHFYIGNIYFNTTKYPEALEHFEKSFHLTPSLPTMINLTNAYLKLNKYKEALDMVLLIALVDLNSAEKILAQFPKDILKDLPTIHPDISATKNISQTESKAKEKNEFLENNLKSKSPETENAKPSAAPPKAEFNQSADKTKPIPPIFLKPQKKPSDNLPQEKEESENTASLAPNEPVSQSDRLAPDEESPQEKETPLHMASLERSEPIPQSDRIKPTEELPQATENEFKMESSSNIFSSNIQNAHQADNKNDEFISRAFKLASQLENDFGKKITFNVNGITEVEKKIRITFLGDHFDYQQKVDLVLDCAAFLCYMLKEKHKGKLIKFADFDPWAWPMLFENSEMVTYPIERLWRLISLENIPDAGWLIRYVQYLDGIFQTKGLDQYSGITAVKNKIRSHPEKIIDAQAEHKKIMILNSSLDETSSIKISQTGISELENSIKIRFKPQVPPSSEGWKLLRCYAHIFAEILIKEFNFQWFNTEGNDGQWSMHSPWMTFIFPLGKVYKCAANGESLTEYFEYLLAEKEEHT